MGWGDEGGVKEEGESDGESDGEGEVVEEVEVGRR